MLPSANSVFPRDVLVGVTTYAGSFETRQILVKMLRHLRRRNGNDLRVALFSDGPVTNAEVRELVTALDERPGPSGLQAGELESLRRMVRYAQATGAKVLVKIAGDVIMNKPEWVPSAVEFHRTAQRPLLSTHWFQDDSWTVGTKFLVAEVDFLATVLPESLQDQLLEVALTENIRSHMPIEQAARLINSNTGERHEVRAELALWQWKHAHRLYKFRHLDDSTPWLSRSLSRALVYPALRLAMALKRALRRLKKSS